MKYLLRISLLVLIALMAFPDDAMAQRGRRKKKKKKKEVTEINWQQNVWYGGGFGLGFGSSGFGGGLNGNTFFFGLSPMAGYKMTNWLSVGPRIDMTYFTGRYQFGGGGQVYKLNSLSYGIGPFMRLKTNFNIFGHFEYLYQNEEFTDGQITSDNRLNTFRQSDDAFFIGLGYNSSGGGLWGYEMYLVYDLLAPENSANIPIEYRFGITYRF